MISPKLRKHFNIQWKQPLYSSKACACLENDLTDNTENSWLYHFSGSAYNFDPAFAKIISLLCKCKFHFWCIAKLVNFNKYYFIFQLKLYLYKINHSFSFITKYLQLSTPVTWMSECIFTLIRLLILSISSPSVLC